MLSDRKFIYVFSLDMDGCVLNPSYHRAKIAEEEKKSSDVIDQAQLIIDANPLLLSHMKTTIQDNPTRIFKYKVGSLRQTPHINLNHKTPHAPVVLQMLHAHIQSETNRQEKDCHIDPYLLADTLYHQPAGTFFAYRDIAHEEKKLGFIHDDRKIIILYAQMHKIASENPDAQIEFDFFDDSDYVHMSLDTYYKANLHRLPPNVRLNIWNYNGDELTKYSTIENADSLIDYHYEQTTRKMLVSILDERDQNRWLQLCTDPNTSLPLNVESFESRYCIEAYTSFDYTCMTDNDPFRIARSQLNELLDNPKYFLPMRELGKQLLAECDALQTEDSSSGELLISIMNLVRHGITSPWNNMVLSDFIMNIDSESHARYSGLMRLIFNLYREMISYITRESGSGYNQERKALAINIMSAADQLAATNMATLQDYFLLTKAIDRCRKLIIHPEANIAHSKDEQFIKLFIDNASLGMQQIGRLMIDFHPQMLAEEDRDRMLKELDELVSKKLIDKTLHDLILNALRESINASEHTTRLAKELMDNAESYPAECKQLIKQLYEFYWRKIQYVIFREVKPDYLVESCGIAKQIISQTYQIAESKKTGIKELTLLINTLDTVRKGIVGPRDKETYAQAARVSESMKTKHSTLKLVGGLLLTFFASLLLATSVTAAIGTFGVATPASIVGITIATTIFAKVGAIAGIAGSCVLGIGGISLAYQGKTPKLSRYTCQFWKSVEREKNPVNYRALTPANA